jgi:HEAT repeat protein
MTRPAERGAVGVFTTDKDLVVSSWDIWMSAATTVAQEDARGRPLLELFPEIQTRGLAARLRKVVEEGTVDVLAPAFHHYLIQCATANGGEYFTVMQQHVTLSPLREQGTIAGLIVTIEDVTARCVRERKLTEQLKSEDEAIRLRATRQLADENAGAPLVDALGDSSWQVRKAAAAGLAEHRNTDAIAQLVEIVRDKHTDLATLNASLSALTLAKRDSLPLMVTLLQNDDSNVRMYTALALGNMQDERALPHLIPLVTDPDLNVRYHVIEALGRIGSTAAVEPLLEVVRERDHYLAFAALDALAAIGEPSAMPDVIELIDDPVLGSAAIDALAAVGNEQAAGPLTAVLATSPVPTAVCNAVSRIHDRLQRDYGEGALVADLVRTRIDPSAASRIVGSIPRATDAELPGVARVLGWLPYPGLENALCSLLKHAPSRRNAQEALVSIGTRALPPLLRELEDEDVQTRVAAAAVLGRIGGAESVHALCAMLENEQADVAVIVIGALGGIGSPEAFRPLLSQLGHSDAAVRHAAVSAINSIAHPDTSREMRRLLQSTNSLLREAAVKIAGYFGFRDCFDEVVALVQDESPYVRRAVVEHLPYFEDARNISVLSRAFRDHDSSVRAAAARAIAHVDPVQADSLVDAPLTDADPRVRYQAVQAVGTHKLRRFAPLLREIVEHDSAMPARIAAAIALGELQDPHAVDALTAMASHSESDLACPSIIALSRIPRVDMRTVLEAAMFGDDPRRQLAAVQAASNGANYLPQLGRVATSARDSRVVSAALRALVASGDEQAIATVIDLCAREDRRIECMNALANAADNDAPIVARGLRHRDARVRWAVAQALGRMRRAAASKELGVALKDPDATVRFAAAQALGRLDMLANHTAQAPMRSGA